MVNSFELYYFYRLFRLIYDTINMSPSKVILLLKNKLGTARKKGAMAYFRHCPKVFLYTLKAAKKSFKRGSRCCSGRSNQVLPKYTFLEFPLHQNFRLIYCHHNKVFEQKSICMLSISIVSTITCRLVLLPLLFHFWNM